MEILIIVLVILITIDLSFFILGNVFFNIAFVRPKKIKPHKSGIINDTIEKYKDWWTKQEIQEVNIKSNDNLNLVAYYLKAKSSVANKTVILVHGHLSNAKELGNYAEYYLNQGFNVLIPDNRAHGKSEGKILGMGYLERDDYKLWINKVIELDGSDVQIILHGISMGAAIVMMISNEILPGNVKCIIEDSGYSNIMDIYKKQLKLEYRLPSFPLMQVTDLICRIRAGYSPISVRPIDKVKKSRLPILFIHGEEDTYIPLQMAYDLYKSCQSEKELLIIKDAKHVEGFYIDKENYTSNLENFYNKYI